MEPKITMRKKLHFSILMYYWMFTTKDYSYEIINFYFSVGNQPYINQCQCNIKFLIKQSKNTQ